MNWRDAIKRDPAAGEAVLELDCLDPSGEEATRVVRDVLDVLHAGRREGIRRLTIRCEAIEEGPTVDAGCLCARLEKVLERFEGRLVHRFSRSERGEALIVDLLWAHHPDVDREAVSRVHGHLDGLTQYPSADQLPVARRRLARVFADWGVPPVDPPRLACWLPELQDVTHVPPDVLEEVRDITRRWGACELVSEEMPLEERHAVVEALLPRLDPCSDLKTCLQMARTTRAWDELEIGGKVIDALQTGAGTDVAA